MQYFLTTACLFRRGEKERSSSPRSCTAWKFRVKAKFCLTVRCARSIRKSLFESLARLSTARDLFLIPFLGQLFPICFNALMFLTHYNDDA